MQRAKVSGKELPGSNHNRLYLVILSVLFILTLPVKGAGQVSFSEIQALEYSTPNEVIPYGAGEYQFAEYWHPGTSEPALVILIHGGCWSNEYGLDHIRALASKLKGSGYAVWSTEYRRVGDAGGGFAAFHLRGYRSYRTCTFSRQRHRNLRISGQGAFWNMFAQMVAADLLYGFRHHDEAGNRPHQNGRPHQPSEPDVQFGQALHRALLSHLAKAP